MSKAIAPLILVAALGLAACSPKAQNETAEAANTIAADANATMAEAVKDTDAAANQAFGAAENSMDNASAKIGKATKDAKADAAGALKDAGNDIED
jgi:hypothetical protein